MVEYIGAWPTIALLVAATFAWAKTKKWLKRRRDQGWLYFIGNGEGPIKVGITRGTPQDRCRDLQTGNPRRLRVLHAFKVKDPLEVERRIHNLLGEYNVGGEWFDRDVTMHLLDDLKGDNVIDLDTYRRAS